MSFAPRASTSVLDRYEDRHPDSHYTFSWIQPGGNRGGTDVALRDRLQDQDRGRLHDGDSSRNDRARRAVHLEPERPSRADITTRALARPDGGDRNPPVRSVARPQALRRQSSLNTFDRPHRRYYDEDDDCWQPPLNVPIPLPIPRGHSSSRRRSPVRGRYRNDDFDDRAAEPVLYQDGRERSRSRMPQRSDRNGRGESRYRAPSNGRSEKIIEISPTQSSSKKGRTRMHKRAVRKKAIRDLGYSYTREGDFIVIDCALEEHQIDQIINLSRQITASKKGRSKDGKRPADWHGEEKVADVPLPPHAPTTQATRPVEVHAPQPGLAFEPTMAAPPYPSSLHPQYAQHAQHAHQIHQNLPAPPHSVRTVSPSRHEFIRDPVGDPNSMAGPLIIVPSERRTEREIKDEIRRLENERRALQLERRADELRSTPASEYEVIEEQPRERNVIRVDKSRKVRSRSRQPGSKLVAALMTTLT